LPAPSPQSQSTNRDQLLCTTTTCSVGRRAALPIAYIAYGNSGLQRQALTAQGIQPVCRLLDQRGRGRGPAGAATTDQEAEEEEEVSPALRRNP
jgi:hypothetical protein